MDERRLSELERDVGRLEEKAEQVPVLIEQVAALRADFRDHREAVARRADKTDEAIDGLRRVVLGFAVTLSSALILYVVGHGAL